MGELSDEHKSNGRSKLSGDHELSLINIRVEFKANSDAKKTVNHSIIGSISWRVERGASSWPPYDTKPGGPSEQISMRAPFLS